MAHKTVRRMQVARFALASVAAACLFFTATRAMAVPTTVTYDFQGVTGPSTGHRAFWDDSSAFTTATAPATLAAGENAELATANYREIDVDDTTNTGTLNSSNVVRHFRFEFVLTHKVPAITQIAPFWIGSSATTAVTQTLYVWNEATLLWETLGSHTATTDTQIAGTPIAANFANYVDAGGVLQLCVVAADPGGAARAFRTDYVRLVVSADTTLPGPPAALAQYRLDGVTPIATGGTTPESGIVAKATASDPDADTVRLAVEIQPVGTAFTGTATATGALVASGGTAQANPTSLANANYHWQAWVIDQNGGESGKVAFAGNPETATDVRVDRPPTSYYVAKTGVDAPCALTRENNAAAPFLTIQAALNCLKTNRASNLTGLGQFVIQIQDTGTYAEMVTLAGLTTTAIDTLTFQKNPALTGRPVIDGGNVRQAGINLQVESFITIDGIEFTNFGAANYSAGIGIRGSDNEVRNCVIHDTGDFGILIGYDPDTGASVASPRNYLHHNVFDTILAAGTDAANRGDCVHIMTGSTDWRIENNTFYACATSGIYTMSDAAAEVNGIVRNNVFVGTAAATIHLDIGAAASGGQTGLVSDYNDLFPGPGAVGRWDATTYTTLAAWQAASGKDANSLSVDPLFVNAAAGDFHELSSSGNVTNAAPTTFTNAGAGICGPGIDLGDPAVAWQLELFDNGMRVNQGAYGNTPQASKSCACLEARSDGTDLNDARTATRVCPLVTTVTESGAEASGVDTTDWYFFNTSVAGPYKFDATITSAAQFDLFLYDAAGALLASDAPGLGGSTGPAVTRSVTFTLPEALHYVEVRYVSGTSTYDLTATASAPLSSSVLDLRAEAMDAFVRVSWETDLDSDALSFRVLRSEHGNTSTIGPDPLAVPIAGAGSYVQDDLDVTCGVRYAYSLEERSPDGVLVHGPITVTACEAAGADQDPGGGCSGILATSRPPGTPLGFAAAAALAVAAALARSRPRRA